MVTGKDIRRDVSHVFHVLVVTLVHGALESEHYKPLSEAVLHSTVIYECFGASFDFDMDVFDGKNLLHHQILTLEYFGEGQLLELLRLLAILNHKNK